MTWSTSTLVLRPCCKMAFCSVMHQLRPTYSTISLPLFSRAKMHLTYRILVPAHTPQFLPSSLRTKGSGNSWQTSITIQPVVLITCLPISSKKLQMNWLRFLAFSSTPPSIKDKSHLNGKKLTSYPSSKRVTSTGRKITDPSPYLLSSVKLLNTSSTARLSAILTPTTSWQNASLVLERDDHVSHSCC